MKTLFSLKLAPLKLAGAALCVAALAGCANTAGMRTLASQTSAHLATQEAGVSRFVATSTQVNRDNASTLDSLNDQAAASRARTARLLRAWSLSSGGGPLIAAQADVTRVQGADIVAAMAVTRASPPGIDDGGSAAAIEKANGAYVALAKKPGFFTLAREAFGAAGAVYQAAAKDEQKAQAAAAAPPATPAN